MDTVPSSKMPVKMPEFPTRVSAFDSECWLSAHAHPGRQQQLIVGSVPLTRQSHIELLAPSFNPNPILAVGGI